MTKESLLGIQKRPIFRETFADETTTRANGGVPTAVTFSSGVASCVAGNSSKIVYKQILSGTYSVRIKLNNYTITNALLIDFRGTSGLGTGWISFASTTAIDRSSGTPYVNAVATSTIPNSTTTPIEIVVTGIPISSVETFINSRYSSGNFGTASYELIEIYEGTLAAQEVKNLYENKRYVALSKHGDVYGSELILNGGFDTDVSWLKSGGANILNGLGYMDWAYTSSTSFLYQAFSYVANKKYTLTFTIVAITGQLEVSSTSASHFTAQYYTTTGTKTFTFTCGLTSSDFMRFLCRSAGQSASIDNVSLKEVVSNNTEILNVDGKNVTISNKYSGSVNQTELITNGTFDSGGTGWTVTGESTVNTGVGRVYSSAGAISTVSQTASKVAGKKYLLEFDILGTPSGTFSVGNFSSEYLFTDGQYTAGHKRIEITSVETGLYFKRGSAGQAADVTIDNVSLKEIIPTLVNTAVTSVRSGDINAMNFDGATSKLDCGSYDTLVGDKTFIAWVKARSFSTVYGNRLFDNYQASFKLAIASSFNSPVAIQFTSNASTTASTNANTIIVGRFYLLIATRTSAGLTNLYINGVLASSADQSSGTPVVGTSGIIVGNNAAGDRSFNGLISGARIVSGILSVYEISQLFSNERKNYNV